MTVQSINTILLPTDVVLNLACENVGVHPETCVLEDPENPYVNVPISEFDVFNPDAPFNKLVLDADIPDGPTGAKARFYLWATALARQTVRREPVLHGARPARVVRCEQQRAVAG